jgi:energy-coupling factor transporter ATP-binding protein EcfA2
VEIKDGDFDAMKQRVREQIRARMLGGEDEDAEFVESAEATGYDEEEEYTEYPVDEEDEDVITEEEIEEELDWEHGGEEEEESDDEPPSDPRPTKKKKRKKKPAGRESLYTPTIEEWGDIVESKETEPSFIDQILPVEPGEGVLLAGRTGVGKTNLGLYMAYCLASGKPFYGFDCEKTSVAFFAFEGGETNYLARRDKIKKLFPSKAGNRVRFAIIPTRGSREMYAEVMGRLVELPDVRVVILDGARHIVEGNPSKTADAQNFIQQLKANLVELGMSAVLTLQIVKPNKNSLVRPGDIYSIKGAVEFAAWSTTSLLIEKQMRKDAYNIYFDKHRIATKEDLRAIGLVYSFPQCCFIQISDEVSEASEQMAKELRQAALSN